MRNSSRVGSKLEHFLLFELGKRNIKVEFHKEHWLQNHNLQVDLYLPEYSAAIEVDGPSHFKPVWGQDNLNRNIKSDQQKTGLILCESFVFPGFQPKCCFPLGFLHFTSSLVTFICKAT